MEIRVLSSALCALKDAFLNVASIYSEISSSKISRRCSGVDRTIFPKQDAPAACTI